MAIIDFPSSPSPRNMAWRLVMPSQTNVSEWTGARQTMSSGRGWWECMISLPPIVGASAFAPWRSFIAKARGSANEFRVPVDPTSQGDSLPATVQVNGANQTGRTLVTDGWGANGLKLIAGQFVTVSDQLLQLTADVTSVSGSATLSFEPPLRSSPADNASIEVRNPFALMHFTEEPSYNVDLANVYDLSLSLREAF